MSPFPRFLFSLAAAGIRFAISLQYRVFITGDRCRRVHYISILLFQSEIRDTRFAREILC